MIELVSGWFENMINLSFDIRTNKTYNNYYIIYPSKERINLERSDYRYRRKYADPLRYPYPFHIRRNLTRFVEIPLRKKRVFYTNWNYYWHRCQWKEREREHDKSVSRSIKAWKATRVCTKWVVYIVNNYFRFYDVL